MLGSKHSAGNRLGLKRGARIDLIGAKVQVHQPAPGGGGGDSGAATQELKKLKLEK